MAHQIPNSEELSRFFYHCAWVMNINSQIVACKMWTGYLRIADADRKMRMENEDTKLRIKKNVDSQKKPSLIESYNLCY